MRSSWGGEEVRGSRGGGAVRWPAAAREEGGWRIGTPEVEDTPDWWVPPVGEREREERERWAAGVARPTRNGPLVGRKEGGEWAAWAEWGWVCFSFFSFSNPF
jgi:hypothetical protein